MPIPWWVKADLDAWISAADVREGKLSRSIRKDGAVWGLGVTQNVVWYVVKKCAQRAGIDRLAPHDLRRSCARLCHSAGGELEQIQFLLGHVSVQTTETLRRMRATAEQSGERSDWTGIRINPLRTILLDRRRLR